MGVFRRVMPKSLFGRTLLIIVMPVAMMQVAVVWSFFEEHWNTVTGRLSDGVAGEIATLTTLFERAGGDMEAFQSLRSTANGMQISVRLEEGENLPTTRRTSFFRALDRTLGDALNTRLDKPFWFDTTRYPAYVDIRVQVEGGVLRYLAPRDRVFATTGHIFILWIVGATSLLTAISIIFIRNQVKPIRRLAEAADRFGRGQDVGTFKPAGATEVRQAAHAFMEMRARILRHIGQRTTLLAGVSHDLRTPLTRLRLQLALMPEGEERDAAIKDVADMEAMLDEYLAFARGMAGEESTLTDLAAMAAEVAADAERQGGKIHLAAEGPYDIHIRPVAVKRCLTNLVANAQAFGETIEISVRRRGSRVEIVVDDDGPGIPEDKRDDALKPFARLDDSRNQNRKGVGLGLAIARDVARSHGGDIRLSDSPLGGLRAVLSLPG